jgi:hypothetical protein
MRRFRFALAVLGTSLLLVLGIGAVGYWTVSTALAQGFSPFGPHMGGPFAGHALPPELQGLEQLPPAERFKHFSGAQVSLKDKDNNPMTINVTPGTVNAVSATSLTLAANDGSTKTFTLDDKTVVRGKPDANSQRGNQPAATTLKQGDLVAVVTKNNETTAKFVMSGGTEGFGPRGGHGPFGGPWGGR